HGQHEQGGWGAGASPQTYAQGRVRAFGAQLRAAIQAERALDEEMLDLILKELAGHARAHAAHDGEDGGPEETWEVEVVEKFDPLDDPAGDLAARRTAGRGNSTGKSHSGAAVASLG